MAQLCRCLGEDTDMRYRRPTIAGCIGWICVYAVLVVIFFVGGLIERAGRYLSGGTG